MVDKHRCDPNGVVMYPDESMRMPDGSTMLPNGQLVWLSRV